MQTKKYLNSKTVIWSIISIICISINLRAPLTSVSSVLPEIIQDLKLSSVQAGLITTIPLFAFGCLSIIISELASKVGLGRFLWYAMPILIVGLLLRSYGSVLSLLLGAGIIGIAITIGNVIMPAFIKSEFPQKLGLFTGINALSMNLTGALAAGLSVPIGNWTGLGWKGATGIWAISALVGFLIWIPQKDKAAQVQTSGSSFKELFRSPLAWYITIFMGLQSCLFYVFVAWLPVVLQDWGMSSEQAAWTFSYIQMTQLPITLIGPILTARIKNHTGLILFTTLVLLLGILGLIIFKTQWVIPSVICIGIGTGLAFSIVLMFFVLKTQSAIRSAQLSGMAQSFGYLIAAASPPLFGYIHDVSGSWTASLWLLVPMCIILCVVGVLSSSDKKIH